MSEEKISIVTDEISQDFDTVARFLNENNIHTLEIRTAGGKRIPKFDDHIWELFRMRVRNEGWKILALSPGTFKSHYLDEEQIGRDLEEILPETIGKAVEIDAGNIITFGFMADPDDEVPGHVIGALERAAVLCQSANINLLLENEPGSFADTGVRTRQLIDLVGHPNLFANWDPCNSNIFSSPDKLADNARALGDFIKHVHVKDACSLPVGYFPKYGPISTGLLRWKEHLSSLKEIGYNGYFGIETHYEPLYESSAILLGEIRELLNEIDFWGGF